MLSIALLTISSSILAMDKAAPAKPSAEVAAAKKAGDEKKANDVNKSTPKKEATKKHSLLACLACDSSKEK